MLRQSATKRAECVRESSLVGDERLPSGQSALRASKCRGWGPRMTPAPLLLKTTHLVLARSFFLCEFEGWLSTIGSPLFAAPKRSTVLTMRWPPLHAASLCGASWHLLLSARMHTDPRMVGAAASEIQRHLTLRPHTAETFQEQTKGAAAIPHARAAELEFHHRKSQEARDAVAALIRRLTEPKRRIAEIAAAPQAALAPSPHPTPDTPVQDALEAAMRILNHGVGPYPPCEEAVRLLRSAEAQGNPDALCELALCMHWGRGVPLDMTESKVLWREAMAKGSVEAAGYLGSYDSDFLANSPPALVDAAVARWRERAAQGHADAQFFLGRCYCFGISCAKDEVCACRWFRRSAEQGCAAGQNNLALRFEQGEGVREDKEEAVRIYRLSAEQGFAFGQYNLGRCLMYGIGVKHDLVEGKRWVSLSAEQGYSNAQQLLGPSAKDTR